MTRLVEQHPVTNRLLVVLAAATSWPVGDNGTTDSAGVNIDTSKAYSIVWGIPGGTFDGTFGEPTEEAVFRYQLDSVNWSRAGAEALADANRKALRGWPFEAVGWRIMRIDITAGAPINQGRDEQNDLTMHVVSDDLAVYVVPGTPA